VTTLAILASSLEKFATEIRHLQRTEVLEVEEPFEEGQAGSSAMPHKRNPEKCERVCGLARVVRGYAVTSLENVSLWHERDLTDSAPERIILPDACLLVDYILDLFTYVMRGLQVYPERMRENLELTQGLVFTSRALVALVNKGLSREKATSSSGMLGLDVKSARLRAAEGDARFEPAVGGGTGWGVRLQLATKYVDSFRGQLSTAAPNPLPARTWGDHRRRNPPLPAELRRVPGHCG
jgi:argininosuccinate lyase